MKQLNSVKSSPFHVYIFQMGWSIPPFMHAACMYRCVEMCKWFEQGGRLASQCTVAGAHTWPNALASNPLTDPTCRQLCSLIPIKSGLQHMCESRFRKEWWEQCSLFGWWKWRIINHRKSCYIIMYIILFIVVRVLLLSLCSCLWPVVLYLQCILSTIPLFWGTNSCGIMELTFWTFDILIRANNPL